MQLAEPVYIGHWRWGGALSFDSQASEWLMVDGDGSHCLWSVNHGNIVRASQSADTDRCDRCDIPAVSFDPTLGMWGTGSWDGSFRLWRREDEQVVLVAEINGRADTHDGSEVSSEANGTDPHGDNAADNESDCQESDENWSETHGAPRQDDGVYDGEDSAREELDELDNTSDCQELDPSPRDEDADGRAVGILIIEGGEEQDEEQDEEKDEEEQQHALLANEDEDSDGGDPDPPLPLTENPKAILALTFDTKTSHWIGLDCSGVIHLWRYEQGQLQTTLAPPTTIFSGSQITALTSGGNHRGCVVLGNERGELFCLKIDTWTQHGVLCTVKSGADVFDSFKTWHLPIQQYLGALASLATTGGQLFAFGYAVTATTPPQGSPGDKLAKVSKFLQHLGLNHVPQVKYPVECSAAVFTVVMFVAVLCLQEKVEERKFLFGAPWSVVFLGMSVFCQVITGPGLLPLLGVLFRVFNADAQTLMGLPCLLTGASLASVGILLFESIRFMKVDGNLDNITLVANPFDWSLDLKSTTDTRRQLRIHPLSTCSVHYNVIVVILKVFLCAIVSIIPQDGQLGQIIVACITLIAGIGLLLLGIVEKRFFTREPDGAGLPMGIDANGLQTAIDAAMVWQYALQLARVLTYWHYGCTKQALQTPLFEVLLLAMLPVATAGYWLRSQACRERLSQRISDPAMRAATAFDDWRRRGRPIWPGIAPSPRRPMEHLDGGGVLETPLLA